MTSGSNLLLWLVHVSGALLSLAVYVGGFVITLRRWHLGIAPRLGAIGFGILAFNVIVGTIAVPVVNVFAAPSEAMLPMMVVNSVAALLAASGHLLLVLALHNALRDDFARSAAPGSSVWRSGEEQAP